MIKVNICLTFPMGAKFKGHPKKVIYKLFSQMIHRICCINTEKRCCKCPIASQCNYANITGNHFHTYPGIILSMDSFEKTVFRTGKELILDYYLIGTMKNNLSYIEMFFKDYLHQNLVGNAFYIKRIDVSEICENRIKVDSLHIKSIVETKNIEMAIKNMCDYYNNHFLSDYTIEISDYSIDAIMNTTSVGLSGRRIKGFLYNVDFNSGMSIPSSFINIGLGKYNYLGGGKYEITNMTQ